MKWCLGLVLTGGPSFPHTENQATFKFKTQATESEMYVCKLSDFMSASDVSWIQIASFGVGGAGRRKPKNDLQNKSLIRMSIIECNPVSSLSAFLWWLQMSPFSPAMWGNNLDKITLFVCKSQCDAHSWQPTEQRYREEHCATKFFLSFSGLRRFFTLFMCTSIWSSQV